MDAEYSPPPPPPLPPPPLLFRCWSSLSLSSFLARVQFWWESPRRGRQLGLEPWVPSLVVWDRRRSKVRRVSEVAQRVRAGAKHTGKNARRLGLGAVEIRHKMISGDRKAAGYVVRATHRAEIVSVGHDVTRDTGSEKGRMRVGRDRRRRHQTQRASPDRK